METLNLSKLSKLDNSLYEINEAISLDIKGSVEDFFSTPRGSMSPRELAQKRIKLKSSSRKKHGGRKPSVGL